MNTPRIVATLVGDPQKDAFARIKYGHFLNALNARFPVVDVVDTMLHGLQRLRNALSVADPNPKRWREKFHKNVGGFRTRSEKATKQIHTSGADLILQIGALFNAFDGSKIPGILYTDYTASMSARKKSSGRSPF